MPKPSKKKADTSDSDSGPEDKEPVRKKVKSDSSFRTEAKEPTWDLGKNRFLSISDFKGRTFVSIREFYTDASSGELRPSKKGIMLALDQWQRIRTSFDEIEQELQKK